MLPESVSEDANELEAATEALEEEKARPYYTAENPDDPFDLHMHNMNYYVSLSSKCDGSTSGKFKFSFKHTPYKDAQKGKSMCDTFIHHLAVQQYSLWRSIFWKRVCLSTWLMDINIHVLQLQNGIQNTGRTKTRNMRYTNCTGADNILKYTG